MRLAVITSFISLSLISYNSHSQGCSDAGFCTMGAMKPDQPFNRKVEFRLRSLELSFYRGTTSVSPIIYVATADLSFSLNNKTSVQLKVPYLASTGRLGKTGDLSDIALCLTRNIVNNDKFDVNLSLGTKIPTNNSDKTDAGRPLPMYYQTSLGTYDVITGISLISRKWLFATGIQHPFNTNGNKFTWGSWADFSDQTYMKKYAVANELKRGTDVMIRVERNFRFSRFNFTLGLLPIYRITRDEITRGGVREKLKDGQGLALSAIFTTGYSFNVRSGIKLLVGRKITNREINPDGLSREFVSSFSYYFRF